MNRSGCVLHLVSEHFHRWLFLCECSQLWMTIRTKTSRVYTRKTGSLNKQTETPQDNKQQKRCHIKDRACSYLKTQSCRNINSYKVNSLLSRLILGGMWCTLFLDCSQMTLAWLILDYKWILVELTFNNTKTHVCGWFLECQS